MIHITIAKIKKLLIPNNRMKHSNNRKIKIISVNRKSEDFSKIIYRKISQHRRNSICGFQIHPSRNF